MTIDLKIEQLNALLLAITGSSGVEVLHEMGDESANAYLAACQTLAHECVLDARVRQGVAP